MVLLGTRRIRVNGPPKAKREGEFAGEPVVEESQTLEYPSEGRPARIQWRLWGKRLAVLLVLAIVPVLLLAGIETAFRLAGYGHSTRFLIGERNGGETFYRSNKAFFQQFFSLPVESFTNWDELEFAVPAKKAANACRIFVFGGSAANGAPPDAAYSFWRILDAMLTATFPNVSFEVYCVACPMANSHVMQAAAQACAHMQPDIFLTYMGDNEMTGPFGAGSQIADSVLWRLPFIRATTWFSDLRISQWLKARLGRQLVSRDQIGLFFPSVAPSDPKITRMLDYLQKNLLDMCRAGARGGAVNILCTPGANLRNCGPGHSEHASALTDSDRSAWDALFEKGAGLEGAGQAQQALQTYAQAAALDSTYAELQFRMGRCCWGLGDFEAARVHFAEACENDFHPDRATTRINAAVKTAAQRSGALLADVAERLKRNSPHEIPGREFFCDNAHPTWEGNYEIACCVFERVAAALPASLRGEAAGQAVPPSIDECAARLAYTPFVRCRHLKEVIHITARNPNGIERVDDADTCAWWTAVLEKVRQEPGADKCDSTLEAYRKALEWNPRDAWITGRYLMETWGQLEPPKALALAQAFVKAHPYRRNANRSLGMALAEMGQSAEAIAQFRKTLAMYPDDSASCFQLGTALVGSGDLDGAVAAFSGAAALNPHDAAAKWQLGMALVKKGSVDEGIAALRAAAELNPQSAQIRIDLIQALCTKGDLKAAREEAGRYGQSFGEIPQNVRDQLK